MSEYTVYDFHESLFNSEIAGQVDKDNVASVLAAWGENGMCSEWSGGFLLAMKDGRFAYVTGWCDTTGWGCQDGASVTYYATRPALSDLGATVEAEYNFETGEYDKRAVSWDEEPADLNRYVASGFADGERFA